MAKLIVRKHIAKFSNKDCKKVIEYMNQGYSVIESFEKVIQKCRHNPLFIIGIEVRNDKYFWIFKLLEQELNQCIR